MDKSEEISSAGQVLVWCLFLRLESFQVVGDGEAREDCQTLVPHVEHGTHGLGEGDVESVQVL